MELTDAQVLEQLRTYFSGIDTDDIENNLNNFQADKDIVMSQILRLTVQNNAMLQVLMNNQIALFKAIDPTTDVRETEILFSEQIAIFSAQIQAFIWRSQQTRAKHTHLPEALLQRSGNIIEL